MGIKGYWRLGFYPRMVEIGIDLVYPKDTGDKDFIQGYWREGLYPRTVEIRRDLDCPRIMEKRVNLDYPGILEIRNIYRDTGDKKYIQGYWR